MIKKSVFVPVLLVFLATTLFASDVNPDSIIMSANALQGKVNALSSNVCAIGGGLNAGDVYSTPNLDGVQSTIDNAVSTAARLKSEIESIRRYMPEYKPKPGTAVNAIAPSIAGNKQSQEFVSVLIKNNMDKLQEMNKYIEQLTNDFNNNTLKFAVKTFAKYFDWSKGAAVGILYEKVYAKITRTKTEAETDIEIQKQIKDEIKQLRDEASKDLEARIKRDKETLAQLIEIGERIKVLSGNVDSLISSNPDLFGTGGGVTDEAIITYIKKLKEDEEKKKQDDRIGRLQSNSMGAESILLTMKNETLIMDDVVRFEKWANDLAALAQAAQANNTVAAADDLMGKKVSVDSRISEKQPSVEGAVSIARVLSAKWSALDWKSYTPDSAAVYQARYTAASGKYQSSINSAKAAVEAMQAASDSINAAWQGVKSNVEAGAGEVEKMRGVIDGKPDQQSTNSTYFQANFSGSSLAAQSKALEEALAEQAKLTAELGAAQAAFNEACSYYTWYMKGQSMFEYPVADADYVQAPYPSSAYAKNDREYPIIPAEEYETKHKQAMAYRLQIDVLLNRLVDAGARVRTAAGTPWTNVEVASEGAAKDKKIADMEAILKLHASMIKKAEELDKSMEEYAKNAKENRDKAETAIKSVLAELDSYLSKKMKNSDLQKVLDMEGGLRGDAAVIASPDKKITALFEQVAPKKEAALKKWPNDAQPLIKSVFVNSFQVKEGADEFSLMKDNLRSGRYITFSGHAEPFYLTITKYNGAYDHYTGAPVKEVTVEINGVQFKAKTVKDTSYSVPWEYSYEPKQDEVLNVKIYAQDNKGNITAREDMVSFKVKFSYNSVKNIAQQRLDKLKEAYESENIPMFMSQIGDGYYGDRYALEQNLRDFFRTADNIRVEPVVDFAQVDGDRLIVNFHWNKSFTGPSGTVTQKEFESVLLDKSDKDKVIKATPTLFGAFSNMAPGTGSLARSGMAVLVPDNSVSAPVSNKYNFEEASFFDQPSDPYDIWCEPWGAPTILLNPARNVGIMDMGIKSLDTLASVPADRASYNYDLMSSGITMVAGHCYALTIQNRYFAAFEVLETPLVPADTVYKIRIAYRFQPNGTPAMK